MPTTSPTSRPRPKQPKPCDLSQVRLLKDLCPRRYRHRLVVGSGPGGIGSLRRRGGVKWLTGLARQPMELERCDQRRGRRSRDGDHDVAGSSAKVMGEFAITGWIKALGWIATAVMGVAVAAMFATS